jgi:hypothetical protein
MSIAALERTGRLLYIVFLKPLFGTRRKGLFAFVGQADVHE